MTTKSDLARTLSAELALLSLEQRISLLAVRFPDRARFSTSFGKEDQALTHAILKYAPKVEIFTLDTGRLFEETYSVFHATRDRLGASIKVFTPDQTLLAQFLSAHGPNSFYESVENRLECCRIRKVEPLQRALENAQIWVTGLRRGQSNNRADLPFVQWDSDYNLLKVHPILDWSGCPYASATSPASRLASAE